MGYDVASVGRVRLLTEPDTAMAEALRSAMLGAEGWLLVEDVVTTVSDLGPYVCAAISVGPGKELTFTPLDDEQDPKWSAQASAFYEALARYTVEGEIEFEGRPGESWRYRYEGGALLQVGRNGWDGGPGSTQSEDA